MSQSQPLIHQPLALPNGSQSQPLIHQPISIGMGQQSQPLIHAPTAVASSGLVYALKRVGDTYTPIRQGSDRPALPIISGSIAQRLIHDDDDAETIVIGGGAGLTSIVIGSAGTTTTITPGGSLDLTGVTVIGYTPPAQTLAATLAAGNATGGTSVSLTAADQIQIQTGTADLYGAIAYVGPDIQILGPSRFAGVGIGSALTLIGGQGSNGQNSGNLDLLGGPASGGGSAGQARLIGGTVTTGGGAGGGVVVTGGPAGSGAGGSVNITGGSSTGAANAGQVTITGGASPTSGAQVTVQGGPGTGGVGGPVVVYGGLSSTTDSGAVTLAGNTILLAFRSGAGVVTGRWYINSSGHFLASLPNTYDIGGVGAGRARSGYFATQVITPSVDNDLGGVSIGTATATGVVIGRSGQTTDFPAGSTVDFTGATVTGLATGDASTIDVVGQQVTGTDISSTIPASTLAVDGESLEFEIWGVNTSGGSPDTVSVTFGGTTILTAFNVPATESFRISGTIVRTGASAQTINVFSVEGNGTLSVENTAGTEVLSGALNLTAADAGNALQFTALIVRKWAA